MKMFRNSARTGSIVISLLLITQLNVISASSIRGSRNNTGKILQLISGLIEKNHYNPKAIDDSFSHVLWKNYINALDPLKGIFLQQDIDSLKRFEYTLDDEIHGTQPFTFVSAVHHLYARRLGETFAIDKQLLSKPFHFDIDETVNTNGSSSDSFATSETALKDVRRKMLKYLAIQYFVALQEHNNQYADSVLERVARQRSLEWRTRQQNQLTKEADNTDMFKLFVNTMLHILDPHSEYIVPSSDTIQAANDNEAFVKKAVVQNDGKQIGYIGFSSFYLDSTAGGAHCSEDVAKVLKQLDSIKVDGVVFDLRNNHGGSLQEVLCIVGLLVDNSTVVQIKMRNKKPVALKSPVTKALYKGPVVVLVNEKTASAAEIFTAAMKDYHRGVIIGSRTYGKGTVQRPFSLGEGNGFVKLTFEQFFRINGSSSQIKGIVPDIILPDVYTYQKVREKDNANVLQWDSVAAANYKKLKEDFDIDALQKSETERLSKDSSFVVVDNNNKPLARLQHKKLSLNIDAYKAAMAEQQKMIVQDKSALALPVSQRLKIEPVDSNFSETEKTKWLRETSSDIYINQAVNVIDDMLKLKHHR
ncbi:hypothetical protein A9P82_04770 [Arachidicoccus ginsenosidimutans]|uniref:carboxy terminal-processing peptidase n=1 Tax=Arachidicoccus sp. BS20 TaxID=1850526 RepID=UPI0007F133A2|nr:carboxy terminal-processing peptidase [Arachidicoccus sp. BS20]ANI88658.1 hypothetical protein A9P82_04770 [Arachidicoccus sp. BS20]